MLVTSLFIYSIKEHVNTLEMPAQTDADQCSLVAGQQHIKRKANQDNAKATAAANSSIVVYSRLLPP